MKTISCSCCSVGLLASLVLLLVPHGETRGIPQEPADPVAYLAINALASTDNDGNIVKRRLEMNWFNENTELHKIVLYDADPTLDENATELIVLDAAFHKDRFFLTDIQLEKPTSEELGYTSHCVFPYWIRVEDKETGRSVTQPRCIKAEPTWMSDRKEELGDLVLADLSMAETHDAAAYKDYVGPEDDNWATLAVYAQEESLLQQLQYGVRSLDIRIGYYPTLDEVFWLTHGIIKVRPLSEGLDQVKEFLKNSGDIVIWHTGGFDQVWDDKAHTQLKKTLQTAFANWWVRPLETGWNTTLNEVWSRTGLAADQGRILLTYSDSAHRDDALFFSDRHYTWGNVNDPVDLKNYLDRVVADAFQNDYGFWVAGCQMTPTTDDIIFDRWHGLRDMADRVNRNVTAWFQTEYSAMRRVGTAHDFILSTDAVNVGIKKSLAVAESVRDGLDDFTYSEDEILVTQARQD